MITIEERLALLENPDAKEVVVGLAALRRLVGQLKALPDEDAHSLAKTLERSAMELDFSVFVADLALGFYAPAPVQPTQGQPHE